MAGSFSPVYRQPFRAIYLAFSIAYFLARIPFWTVTAILPSWRPRPSWPLKKVIFLKYGRWFTRTLFKAGPFIPEPTSSKLEPNSGGVWIMPITRDTLVDPVARWASEAKVEPAKIPAYWYVKEKGSRSAPEQVSRTDRVVYFLHGGGYAVWSAHPSSPPGAICRGLLEHTAYNRVLSLEYRLSSHDGLSPVNPFPAALIDALAGYQYLTETMGYLPENILVGGDSAGAHLAMSLVRYVRDTTPHRIPGQLFLVSPWVDLTDDYVGDHRKCMDTDFIREVDTGDWITNSIACFAGNMPESDLATNPYLSPAGKALQKQAPLYKGFPRTFIAIGEVEQLGASQRAAAAFMRRDMGQDAVELYEAKECVHDYLAIYLEDADEKRKTYEAFARWTTNGRSSATSLFAPGPPRARLNKHISEIRPTTITPLSNAYQQDDAFLPLLAVIAAAMSLPGTFNALFSNGDETASVKTIPLVKDLQSHEIIIRVQSVGLNPTDWKSFFKVRPVDVVMGCDAAGDVVKVGHGVKHIQVGDRVAGFAYGGSRSDNGAFAEYVRLDTALVFKFPEAVSYNEAASFPIPHGTALLGLYSRLHLPLPSKPANREDIILVWGGSTAVGHHVVQLAVQSGLRVFVTASSAAHEYLKELGAEQCFDYRDEDVVSKIKKAAGDPGIKYGFDTIAEGGTGIKVVDAIGSQGGHVITLLTQKDAESRRSDVDFEFILLYTVLGSFPPRGITGTPHDRPPILNFITGEFPKLLEGWAEGHGSSKLKPQRLRVLEGGLNKVVEGLDIMRKGAYGREKLVYPIV